MFYRRKIYPELDASSDVRTLREETSAYLLFVEKTMRELAFTSMSSDCPSPGEFLTRQSAKGFPLAFSEPTVESTAVKRSQYAAAWTRLLAGCRRSSRESRCRLVELLRPTRWRGELMKTSATTSRNPKSEGRPGGPSGGKISSCHAYFDRMLM